MVYARAPFRTLSDGPSNTLLECRMLRPGVTVALAVIPGRQVKVAACILNTTAECPKLWQGEQLGMVDASSSAAPMIMGSLRSDLVNGEKETKIQKEKTVSTVDNSVARDEGCRQVIDEMLSELPAEMTSSDIHRVAEL